MIGRLTGNKRMNILPLFRHFIYVLPFVRPLVFNGPVSDVSPPSVTVQEILQRTFKRVPGDKSGGAAIYPDQRHLWCNHSVGTPTVDFDGRTWRMWFVGMTVADNPEIPYGLAARLGRQPVRMVLTGISLMTDILFLISALPDNLTMQVFRTRLYFA